MVFFFCFAVHYGSIVVNHSQQQTSVQHFLSFFLSFGCYFTQTSPSFGLKFYFYVQKNTPLFLFFFFFSFREVRTCFKRFYTANKFNVLGLLKGTKEGSLF